MTPGDETKAVGYVRVSTAEQHLGPEAQRASIEAWARAHGVEVVAWHVDQGVSGATPVERRPGLLAALASLREHRAGRLVAAKRDRIARDVVTAAMLERAAVASGARVVSAAGEGNGDAPADQFMRTVIDGAAAYERGLIRARTKAALAAKAARGERVGGIPFGFALAADGKRLEPLPHEQATIERIASLSAAGVSQRGIARELEAAGVVSRSGRPFTQTQVARILARRRANAA